MTDTTVAIDSQKKRVTKYRFDCGCEIEVVDEDIKDCDGLPGLKIDYDNINYDCPATWDLLSTGHTKGIFQLEKQLGQTWSRQISPRNIDEMSALISLIRPGCLRAIVDGKSMTQHYADRKAGEEEVEYFHEALKPILEETYGVLGYQEQSMKIAMELAGFDLQKADILRKAIGKKKPEIMAKVEKDFDEGFKETGIVTEEEGKQIVGWIRESQKYAFNKSHGVGYGIVGYWTAYVKAHFPFHFFTSWLHYASEKIDPQEEVLELVNDAKYYDVDIKPPLIEHLKENTDGSFYMKNDGVYFGVLDIKGVGKKHLDKCVESIELIEDRLGKPITDWTWYEFLVHFSNLSTTTVVNGLISVGALRHMGVSRSRMGFEYDIWKQLTNREQIVIQDYNTTDLLDAIKMLRELDCPQYTKAGKVKPRFKVVNDLITLMHDPPYELTDTAMYIAGAEQELLGVPITCSRLDGCDKSLSNTTCKEFSQGKQGDMTLVVEILDSKEHIIRRGDNAGKKMGYLALGDETGSINGVVFNQVWTKSKNILFKGNTILVFGNRSTRSADSFIVQKVSPI